MAILKTAEPSRLECCRRQFENVVCALQCQPPLPDSAIAYASTGLHICEPATLTEPITEDWLKSVGFKWHTVSGKDPDPPKEPKHWTLWMGGVANVEPETGRRRMFAGDEDLGLEVSEGFARNDPEWFCWLRADVSHRYSRFLHIRHIRYQHELIQLVEALSGVPWNAANHLYGKIFTAEQIESIRKRDERLDVRIAKASPWSEREKDDSAGRQVGE